MVGTLYTQSAYSILKSTLSLEVIFDNAKNSNHDFVAITDYHNLHALYKILVLSKVYQMKIILGIEMNLIFEDSKIKLLVYARNDKELEYLIKLSSYISMEPKLKLMDIIDELNHLVVVIPNTQELFTHNYNDVTIIENMMIKLKNIINNLFLGISNQSELYEFNITPLTFKIAKNLKIKLLPTYQNSYFKKNDKKSYEIIRKIDNSSYTDDHTNLNFLSKDELLEHYRDYNFVFDNLKQVFSNTKYNYLNNQQELPKFPTKDNVESHIYLNALSTLGLKKRLKNVSNKVYHAYLERLNHELNVIHQMGYDDYFLIVYDFVRYAKTNDILVGPGRGSAAGSLVAYCLGITEVDPLEYNLLFERFLNIDRKTMPDIDLDFPDDKRDLVIEYVKNKYGKNHVVTISTFTNLTTKTSMRDIARQMGMSQSRINAIVASHSKGILDESDLEAMELVRIAQLIEGIPRQTGTHPAGIIISKNDLTTLIPLTNGPKSIFQSQFEASDLESLGFLKIDFLGLKNLSIIDQVLKLENNKIKLSEIPLNDSKTYQLLSNVDVDGVFQLESQGMKNTLRKLKPSNFEDIVAILALYRPGPMQFIDDYIERRHGKKYELLDSSIDHILEPTYGIIVYQEQIMNILQLYAGYSLSEADIIRRAISKKNRDIIEKEKLLFIEKSSQLGKNKDQALKIYNYIEKFADYGFNRSHSVSYALVAYQMAYLKTHYYISFMSVLMSQNVSNTSSIKSSINEMSNKNIKVYGPDINVSTTEFIPYKDGILAPLSLIKGIGNTITQKIIELRPFKDYNDFKSKVAQVLNEKYIEVLIYGGALDIFGLNKATLLDQNNLNQSGFENFLDDYKHIELDELPFNILKEKELEVLGFNLNYTLDNSLRKIMLKYKIKPINLNMNVIKTIGYIEDIRVIKTKNGDDMAFIKFNSNEVLDLICFPNEYKEYKNVLNEPYIYIEATKNKKDNNENSYILKKLKKVKE